MFSVASKTAKTLLDFYFLHEDESFYVNEIVRRLGLDKRNLIRKLKELEKEGVFISELRGNQRYYSLNKKFPLYQEYKNIFMKTIGLEGKLRKLLSGIKGVNSAYLYGSYAQDKMDTFSDIDLIVVGSQDIVFLQGKINKLQKDIDREINMINISQREFDSKKKNRDPFVLDILKKKHIKIV
ncbi:MAG: nucleotidyltransferase domain-containing protein [Candidatus Omnitrophota bacterium]